MLPKILMFRMFRKTTNRMAIQTGNTRAKQSLIATGFRCRIDFDLQTREPKFSCGDADDRNLRGALSNHYGHSSFEIPQPTRTTCWIPR